MSQETVTYTESAVSDLFREFFTSFKNTEGRFSYVEAIDGLVSKSKKTITLQFSDVADNQEITDLFFNDPELTLRAAARAAVEILEERNPKLAKRITSILRVRVSQYPIQKTLREINSESAGRLTSIFGILLRSSRVYQAPEKVTYICPQNHTTEIEAEGDLTIPEPAKCSNPQCSERKLRILPSDSSFYDFQIMAVQELPEDLPAGQLPKQIEIVVTKDLVDEARPGDRVVVTGIAKVELAHEIKLASKTQLYRLRMHCNNIEYLASLSSKTGLGSEISPEDEKRFQEMSERPNFYDQLIHSFAPHVKGYETIKESILLLIAGAPQKILPDNTKLRGDINVFLVGDPGTAKSEMLKFCAKIAPRGLYTSGRGSSAAGLTAAVIKDESGLFVLEAGAIVLGDQGLVCIDEFDKMDPRDRSSLHEGMEQQSISINKGGILATLNARTSVLAAANPVFGKYDPFKNLTENIAIPIPLLTRFDLIFVIRDIPAKEKDAEVSSHILNLYENPTSSVSAAFDVETLSKFFTHIRKKTPKFSSDASKILQEYYLKMRKIDQGEEMSITITPRQLGALVRMSIARARVLQKDVVDEDDANRAIQLMENMLNDAGIDVNTGKVDLGVLQGKPKSETTLVSLMMDIIKSLQSTFANEKEPIEGKALVKEMINSGKWDSEDSARDFLKKMVSDGIFYETMKGGNGGFYGKVSDMR